MSSSVWSKDKVLPRNHNPITASDTVNLPDHSAVVLLTDGDVAAVDKNDTVMIYSLLAGQTVPVICKRINATGTTAEVARLS